MKSIKWIIGYCDAYGKIHYRVVYNDDLNQTHTSVWPSKVAAHGKWRWRPEKEFTIDTYGEDIDDDIAYGIWDIIEYERKK